MFLSIMVILIPKLMEFLMINIWILNIFSSKIVTVYELMSAVDLLFLQDI